MLPDHLLAKSIANDVLGYTPFDEDLLNPASIDMRLSPEVRVPRTREYGFDLLDVREITPDHTEPVVMDSKGLLLRPHGFLLASTVESVRLPNNMYARIEGKSSLGRIGLAVHITAGFIDPGFSGQITLEVANLSPWTIRLRPDMRIAQIAFSFLHTSCHVPYNRTGHYNEQTGPTESRFRM